MHRVLERQLRKIGIEKLPTQEQWSQFLERVDRAYTEADQDRYTLERALDLSSAEMRKRFTELREAQGQLLLASRKAGMADVATNVLHNVGNVLNSVNVSANVIGNVVRTSTRSGLGKALALLQSQPQPGRFLDEDPRGKKLLAYLSAVDEALVDERETMLRETESLAKHIEHIKAIVSGQLTSARSGARGAEIIEKVHLPELLDDAVAVASARSPRKHLRFAREGESLAIGTDRHKVFQILVNLLANASDAVAARPGAGLVTLRTLRLADQRIAIEVDDDGVGIAEETLARIFSHGFTTKTAGHGFGLHASACAAGELGGSLTARSNGLGTGATFSLVLTSARMPVSMQPPLARGARS